ADAGGDAHGSPARIACSSSPPVLISGAAAASSPTSARNPSPMPGQSSGGRARAHGYFCRAAGRRGRPTIAGVTGYSVATATLDLSGIEEWLLREYRITLVAVRDRVTGNPDALHN